MEKEPTKKNIVQDIVPNKRSIRNVELPSRSQKIQPKAIDGVISNETTPPPVRVPNFEKKVPIKKIITEEAEKPPVVPPKISSYRYDYGEKPKSSKLPFYISILVLILVCAFGVSALFKGAKITITPKNETHILQVSDSYKAKKDSTGSDLGFQIVTITKDLEKTLPSDGESMVSKKATGKITIYNSTIQPQKLVILTRFQTAEGLIYKINAPVTVPGGQLKNGKVEPGYIDATVTADVAGEKYNIGKKDFTIPGFKGTAKYTQITAKSKTDMTGGFSGMQKTVSEDLKISADAELEKSLREALASSISLQIPDNFILYDNGISYDFQPAVQVDSKDDGVVIQKRGIARAVIFDKGSLTRVITSKVLPDLNDEIVKVVNLDKLVFSYKDGTNFNPESSESIDFTLSGDALFVWVFDENKLKSDLLGLTKTQARAIIGSYKSIKEAWVVTKPFWNTTIPKDQQKVEFVNTLSN